MRDIENINYTNNQNYIQTNKDDINSFEKLKKNMNNISY